MRLIFAILLFSPLFLVAQNDFIIKLNLTDLIVNRYSVGFEKKLNESFAFEIDIDYLRKDIWLESDHPWFQPPINTVKKGLIIEPQFRWYLFNKESKGIYTSLAGFFGLAKYHPKSNVLLENDDWSSIGGSLHLGFQLFLGKMVIDSFLGTTLANDNYPGPYFESTALFPAPDGLRFSGGIRLGFSI